MERRNFIKKAIVGAGVLSLSSFENDVLAKGKITGNLTQRISTNFKKSIMWDTIGIEGSIPDKCKAVKAAGYDGVEPMSHMNREEVIDALKATGLLASSVCCSTHWGKPLSHPDASVRQEGIEGAIIAMEDAIAYGTDSVLLVPGTVNESVSYDECWERSTESIKKLLPVAKKLKVNICIENVWNNFLLSPVEACNYIDQFKSKYVKFYFDCGNILVYGWPEQWIKILGKRLGRIHIKEFSKKIAEAEGKWKGFNAKLTEGDVNWTNVMDSLRRYYTEGWLTTEQGGSSTVDELKDLSSRFDKILQNI